MRRNLYRLREAAMPPSPKSAAEIVLAYENEEIRRIYGMSLTGAGVESEVFYRKVYTSNQFAYCIFASEQIVRCAKQLEERHIHMDGTFRVVPYGEFNQLLIIHITFFEKVYLFIAFLSHFLSFFSLISNNILF